MNIYIHLSMQVLFGKDPEIYSKATKKGRKKEKVEKEIRSSFLFQILQVRTLFMVCCSMWII